MTTRSPAWPSGANNEELITRLELLAREAGSLRSDAIILASRLIQTSMVGPLLQVLEDDRTLEAVTGLKRSPNDSRERIVCANLLWSSLNLTVARLCGGFALEDSSAIDHIRAALDATSPFGISYWRFDDKVSATSVYARAYFLVSLYAALGSRRDDLIGQHDQVVRLFVSVVNDISRRAFGIVPAPGGEALPPEVTALWQLAIAKLATTFLSAEEANAEKIPPLLSEEVASSQKRILQQCVADALRPGGVENVSVEMADVLSVLCGRVLNPGLQLQPSDQELYEAAVDWLLDPARAIANKNRNAIGVADPLGSRTPPLVFLLDLPNHILLTKMSALTDAARVQLEQIRLELSKLLVLIPENCTPHSMKNADVRQAFDSLYRALVVGTAIAERFRDFLSELELGRLPAASVAGAVEWDALSDSLGFKAELLHVIDLWATRSKSRPGAILVFGPPGTGKTTIAEAFLRRLNETLLALPGANRDQAWRFLQLSPADFAREGSDKVIASAESLFQRLQRLRRCVVLLDEMEEFLRSRGTRDSNRESRLVTTAFLPLLQETVDRREIILIVATNFVGGIDSAITRRGRFDLILPLGPPDHRSRHKIITKGLRRTGVDTWQLSGRPLTKDEVDLIALYTQGYTFGEIQDFLRELAGAATSESSCELKLLLWRIRQEKVPLALSGNPGCDWRKFQDEATRFHRSMQSPRNPGATDPTTPRHDDDSPDVTHPRLYWDDPPLPMR